MYLVQGDDGLLLVDTGMPGSESRVYKALSKLGRRPEEVKLVLITHRHLDHIGSVADVKKKTGQPWSLTSSRNRTSPGL